MIAEQNAPKSDVRAVTGEQRSSNYDFLSYLLGDVFMGQINAWKPYFSFIVSPGSWRLRFSGFWLFSKKFPDLGPLKYYFI